MNCDCIARVETNLAKFVGESKGFPTDVEITVRCESTSILIGASGMSTGLKIPFKVTAQVKGYTRGKALPVMASYCPFCGKSTKAEINHEQ